MAARVTTSKTREVTFERQSAVEDGSTARRPPLSADGAPRVHDVEPGGPDPRVGAEQVRPQPPRAVEAASLLGRAHRADVALRVHLGGDRDDDDDDGDGSGGDGVDDDRPASA